MGHRSISNTVVYTAVADKQIEISGANAKQFSASMEAGVIVKLTVDYDDEAKAGWSKSGPVNRVPDTLVDP